MTSGAAAAVPAQTGPAATASAAQTDRAAACPEEPAAGEPHPDLYCIPLTPTVLAGEAAGAVRLRRPPSPFGASVTVEGVHRWNLALAIRGLADPSTLGPYTAYVAWATTPVLEPVIRLGAVGNGEIVLGPIALNQFFVHVSAEASADVAARTGPLVLRGASASTRMQPHELAAVLASAGVGLPGGVPGPRDSVGRGAAREHAHGTPREGEPTGATTAWTVPPMHPEVPMVPDLMRLRPDVAPYLPANDPEIPVARPAEILDLADGDTLDLVAGPVLRTLKGLTHVMFGFNGMYPGPLVRVDRGSTLVIRVGNWTEWPTAVHWHGVRVENAFDGVVGVTQEAIEPGGTFVYRVRFPDAGIYWYHPHHREDVQQDLGLYGNLRVREPGEIVPVHREEVLLLDDLLIGEEGLVPWGREAATHALMGRFGNVTLVNGEPEWRLSVRRGEVVRFYLTNASNTRTWNVSFAGARMKLVAADVSPFEREAWVESVVLAPAERFVVDVRFDEPGSHAFLHRAQAIDPIAARFLTEVDTLGRVEVSPEPASTETDDPAVPDPIPLFDRLLEHGGTVAGIDALRRELDRPVDRELVLTLEPGELPFPIEPLLAVEWIYVNPVEWGGTMPEMNWAATARDLTWVLRDPATGAENEAIDWRFRPGELVKLRLVGDRDALHPMHHPIHLHGQRFLVVSQGGVRNENLAWKDTVLVPAGDVVEILVEMSNPGRWMLHCHISEHLEAGMRMVLEVAD